MATAPLNVNRDNVLQARAVILAEAESLTKYLNDTFMFGGQVGLCGGDPISRDAAELFNNKIRENMLAPTRQYVLRLIELGDQLAATARSYGIVEHEIETSFSSNAESGRLR